MPDAEQWEEALRTETKQFERLGVFSAPCQLPDGAKKVKTRVVLKKKRPKTGAVERWKARLVAQGFLQTFGVDSFDTCAPFAQLTSFHIIYAIYVYLNLFIESMDADVAFCNATLKKDVYIDPPGGWITTVACQWIEAEHIVYCQSGDQMLAKGSYASYPRLRAMVYCIHL